MAKDISDLSKRRLNQIIQAETKRIRALGACQETIIAGAAQEGSSASTQRIREDISEHSNITLSQDNFDEFDRDDEGERQNGDNCTEENEEHSDEENGDFYCDDIEQYEEQLDLDEDTKVPEESLASELKKWAHNESITQKAMTSLLKVLRRHGQAFELPQDARTLMQTPRNIATCIEQINGGFYAHFGIADGLQRCIVKYFEECPATIDVQVNCDGMSLMKSSSGQFWPILMSISIENQRTKPFVVGVHYGSSKPICANVYLRRFVEEMARIQGNGGIDVNGTRCQVFLKAIVCDTPARSFVTQTKGHSGYYSCSKCNQKGEHIDSVVFPKIDCTLRTDESFKRRIQAEYHTGNSILEELEIGMVSQVLLDYMHLVCLGVMKRLVKFWVKGQKNLRLSKEKLEVLSQLLLKLQASTPSEFSRKLRDVTEGDRWKATECRQFLLYVGPVILKTVLSKPYYEHFLTLSLAIRILCDSELCITMNDYANSLLVYFVDWFKELYGKEYMSHNIHNLVHLANDVKYFKGNLDSFSCFPFENYLGCLRHKIRNSPKPLHQLLNRINEENALPVEPVKRKLYPISHASKITKEITSLEYEGS